MGMDPQQRRSAIIIGGILLFLFTCAHISGKSPDFRDFGSIVRNFPYMKGSNTSNVKWIPRSSPAGVIGSPARSLIASTKDTARKVAQLRPSAEFFPNPFRGGFWESSYASSEQGELWNRRNPCRSRLELVPLYDQRKYAKKLPSNPLWEELFAEYSQLHRLCVREAGNLTDYFLSGNQTTGCKFVVADIAPFTGLGNKVFVLVSSLLYAILTQRVLLVPSSTLVTDITCEPFVGSSWVLDPAKFPILHVHDWSEYRGTPWTHDREFFSRIDAVLGEMDSETYLGFESGRLIPAAPLIDHVGFRNHEWQPPNRFYCTAEQTFYSQATWVYLSGCIYTIPKYFTSPAFRPILEDIFPDKMVMTRLLRSVFLPSDYVWDRVKRMEHTYLAGTDRRVGIQVRYKDGVDHYKRMNSVVNDRISKCTHRNGILPEVVSKSESRQLSSANKSASSSSSLHLDDSQNLKALKVKVYIASLFPGLQNYLLRKYVLSPTVSGEEVALVQISQDGNQVMNSLEEDQQAFTEILLLSLSDQLLVTPISTFGGLAQGYGALTPWFIEMGEDKELEPCQRGQTVDVCNQFTARTYMCRYDPSLNAKKFSDEVPYIKDCLSIDHDSGIQLITTFES